MYKNLKSKEEGFTIIEVVLVLAIAALIFLIVFLALPALQRSRRDTQRKDDAGKIVSSLETYASANNGDYPAAATGNANTNFGTNGAGNSFWERYVDIDDTVRDPSTGNPYTIEVGVNNGDASADFAAPRGNEVVYGLNARCNGEFMQAGGGNREVAVVVEMENGQAFCQDNR
ncbi:type II secretion system protein [Candidatus Saccharibacteria bacterium CPR2]|nr:type II secretion system protein [Candidatus Saccharibacteria bacterium CPR2]